MQFTGVASNELLNQLQALCLSERDLTTQIVLHIAELARRQEFAKTAYLSALGYSTQCLGLSDDEAWRRVSVAKMVVASPAIGVALENRVVTITTLLMIKHMLTVENCERVLASIASKSKREVARWSPPLWIMRLVPRLNDLAEGVRKSNVEHLLPDGA